MTGPSVTPPERRLAGRLIGLGVTGSVAAYKAVELLRLLRAEGADVAVLLTPSAAHFVGPLSFAALSEHPVEVDVLDLLPDGRIGHIVLGDSADAIVVAPATAHWMAGMAAGLSGDVVTAACLATSAPVIVGPAMDGDMWTHPATVANVARLRSFGYTIVDPASGPLASGQTGVGRLAELKTIVDAIVDVLADRPIRVADPAGRPPVVNAVHDADLSGRHLIVTAGGTREAIDPVRFIGNRSTGRMGVALAEAALDRGATVTIIAADVAVPLPTDATIVHVELTAELRAALLRATQTERPNGSAGFDALIMAAAVSDFRPVVTAGTKLARDAGLRLELEATPDLVAEIARIAHGLDSDGATTRRPLTPRPYLVGFAAETGSFDRVADKLARKGIDLLVANDVAERGSGFGTDTNRVTILSADGTRTDFPLQSKRAVADAVLDRVAVALDARDAAAQTDRVTEPQGEPA